MPTHHCIVLEQPQQLIVSNILQLKEIENLDMFLIMMMIILVISVINF